MCDTTQTARQQSSETIEWTVLARSVGPYPFNCPTNNWTRVAKNTYNSVDCKNPLLQEHTCVAEKGQFSA